MVNAIYCTRHELYTPCTVVGVSETETPAGPVRARAAAGARVVAPRFAGFPMHGAGGDQLDAASGLLQLTSMVQGIYAAASEKHDLTPVQAKLLCVLLDGPKGMAGL